MVEKIPSTPNPNISGARGVSSGAASKAGAADAPEHGAAFKALLEKLETQARELEEKSSTVDNPADLAGAVDRAHASLQDALSLGEQLLEAYREALQQPKNPSPAGDTPRDGKRGP